MHAACSFFSPYADGALASDNTYLCCFSTASVQPCVGLGL